MGVIQRSARNVVRKKSRMLLVMIAIALSMAIMISVPSGIMSNKAAVERLNNGYNDLMERTSAEINQTANLIECAYSFRSGDLYLNTSDVSSIGALPNVSAAVPMLNEMLSGTDSMITINGVPLTTDYVNNYNILPTNLTSGRNLVPGDSGVAVIDTNLADKLVIGLEGKIDLNGTSFRVVGIYSPGSFQSQRIPGGFGGGGGFPGGGFGGNGGRPPGEGSDRGSWRNMTRGTVYLSLGDLQAMYGIPGKVNQLDVYAGDVSQVDAIANEIEANYTSLSVTTPKDRLDQLQRVTEMFQAQITSSESTLSSMEALAYQEIALALVATCMIVLFTMVYAVRERTKEVGVLKAIGFSSRDVMKQFLAEGLIICVVAGVVGIIIGNVAAPFLSSALLPQQTQQTGFQGRGGGVFIRGGPGADAAQTAVQFTPDLWLTAAAFGVAVLMGIIGSLYPAWKASRISPMEALRYE